MHFALCAFRRSRFSHELLIHNFKTMATTEEQEVCNNYSERSQLDELHETIELLNGGAGEGESSTTLRCLDQNATLNLIAKSSNPNALPCPSGSSPVKPNKTTILDKRQKSEKKTVSRSSVKVSSHRTPKKSRKGVKDCESISPSKRKRSDSMLPKKIPRKMRAVSPISEDVARQCRETDIDAALDEKATKKGLNAVNVKNLIKNILTHESVVRLVKNAMEDKSTGEEDLLEYAYRLTRSKTKTSCTSSRAQSTLPPSSPSSTACLMALDLSEDSSGEEYQPGEDSHEDSDDDSVMSPQVVSGMGSPSTPSTSGTPSTNASKDEREGTPCSPQSGTFKRPQSLHKKALNFDEEGVDKIGLRTRSRLHLKDTPLEQIEASFVPPDITLDMYDMECDDEDWKNFLREFALPSRFETNEAVDDEEADPEYNILEDEEEPDHEELRKDRAVQISKTEVQQLISELVQDMESSDDEGEHSIPPTLPTFFQEIPPVDVSPAKSVPASLSPVVPEHVMSLVPVVSEREATQNVPSHFPVAVSIEEHVIIRNIEQEEEERIFRLRLEEQMRKHVQLLTQIHMLSVQQPELADSTRQFKDMLDNLDVVLKTQAKQQPVQVCNLPEAIVLTETWEKHVKFHPDYKYRKQLEGKKMNARTPLRMGLEFRKDLVTMMRQSRVFLYPELLPLSPYFRLPENLPDASIGSPVEDQLLAMGLERFHAEIEKTYRHWGVAVVKHELVKAIQVNCMPWTGIKKLEARIDRLRRPKIKQGNPVQYYFMYGKAPDVDRTLHPFDPARKLEDVPGELLPARWQGLLGPTFNPVPAVDSPIPRTRIAPNRLPIQKGKKRSKVKGIAKTANSIVSPIGTAANENIIVVLSNQPYQKHDEVAIQPCETNTNDVTPEPVISERNNVSGINSTPDKSSRSYEHDRSPLQHLPQVIHTNIGNIILSMPALFTPHKAPDTPLKSPLKLINSPVKKSPKKKRSSPRKRLRSPTKLPKEDEELRLNTSSETAPKPAKRYVMLKSTDKKTAIAGNVWVLPEHETSCIRSIEELEAKLSVEPITSTPFKMAVPRPFKQDITNRDEAESDTSEDETPCSLRIAESFHCHVKSSMKVPDSSRYSNEESSDDEAPPVLIDLTEVASVLVTDTDKGKQAANGNNESNTPPKVSSSSAEANSLPASGGGANSGTVSSASTNSGGGGGSGGNEDGDHPHRNTIPDDKTDGEETDKGEREDDKMDNQADLDAFMQASVTIKPKRRSRGTKQQRKQLKEEKMTRGVISTFEAQSPVRAEADKGAFAEKYFRDVREALETAETDNYRRFVLTLAQVQHTGFDAVKVYEELKEILKNHPLLLEEFVGFLTPLEAVQIGKQFEHFMITKMRDFFVKLQVQFMDNKNRLKKVVKTLSEVQSQPGVTVGQVKAAILPLLKGYPYLVDTFLQLFPKETPPMNLLESQDFEEIEIPDSDKSGGSDFETVTLPDSEDLYGTDKCPCNCHENQLEGKLRQTHCLQCIQKFMEGKASVHNPKSVKPASAPRPSSTSGTVKKPSPRKRVKTARTRKT